MYVYAGEYRNKITNILYSILEYVPSPKVYEVCFWKKKKKSMIIINATEERATINNTLSF